MPSMNSAGEQPNSSTVIWQAIPFIDIPGLPRGTAECNQGSLAASRTRPSSATLMRFKATSHCVSGWVCPSPAGSR